MRLLSLTMPAALLLLLCAACNSANQKTGMLARSLKETAMKSPDQPADHEVSDIILRSADSASAGAAATENTDEASHKRSPRDMPDPGSPADPQTAASAAHVPQKIQAGPGQTASANPDWDKKIVKTAILELEVKNYRSFNELLHRAVRQSGGYIAQEEQSQSGYKIDNMVAIKVPVAQFEETLSQLVSDSDKLVEKKISTEDVGMQIVDTRSRLETKREVRERYLDLLKQARNMNEILKVQNEINDIQEQMEGAAGRIAFLGHAAAFSTINMHFYQVLDATVRNEPDPSFLHKLKKAMGDGWSWISGVLIGLAGLWPLGILVGLAWMGIRKWRSSVRSGLTARTSRP